MDKVFTYVGIYEFLQAKHGGNLQGQNYWVAKVEAHHNNVKGQGKPHGRAIKGVEEEYIRDRAKSNIA